VAFSYFKLILIYQNTGFVLRLGSRHDDPPKVHCFSSEETLMQQGGNRRFRIYIAVLLFFVTTINFSDRGILGAVAPILIRDFHLTIAQFGVVGSAFGWGYVLTTFFGGAALMLFRGPKRAYIVCVTIWSVVLGAMAFATGLFSLLVYRIIFGLSEGVVFPSSQQIAGHWFPPKEQGRIAAWCLTLGQPIGPLIATPIAVFLAARYGWRVPFVVFMFVGLVWVAIAAIVLKDRPQDHKAVTTSELDIIGVRQAADYSTSLLRVVSNGYLWICGLCFFGSSYVLYFLLTFFPVYLVQDRHIDYSKIGFMSAAPFLGLAFGALISGWAMDKIWKTTGGSLFFARTLFGAICLFATGATFLAVVAGNWNVYEMLGLVFLAAAFAYAANPVFFAMPMDIIPEYAGAAGALVTGIAASAGIIAPLVTGNLVQATGGYSSAITVVAFIPVLAGIVLLTVNPLGRAIKANK
jgi:MFS family permease